MGGFSCSCPSGFTVSSESNECQGQTEARLQPGCVPPVITCTNKVLFFCFSLCGVDVDECLQGLHMCHYNQQCVNMVGAYRCQAKCGAGFKASVTGSGCEGKLPFPQYKSVVSEMISGWNEAKFSSSHLYSFHCFYITHLKNNWLKAFMSDHQCCHWKPVTNISDVDLTGLSQIYTRWKRHWATQPSKSSPKNLFQSSQVPFSL